MQRAFLLLLPLPQIIKGNDLMIPNQNQKSFADLTYSDGTTTYNFAPVLGIIFVLWIFRVFSLFSGIDFSTNNDGSYGAPLPSYNHQPDNLPNYVNNQNQEEFTTSKPIFNFESKPTYKQTTLSQTFNASPTPTQNLFFNTNPFQSQKPSYKPVPRQAASVSEIVKKMNTLEEMEKATSVQLQQQVESLKKLEQMNTMIKVEKLTQEQQLEQFMKEAQQQQQQQQQMLEKLKQQDLLRQIEEKTRLENLKQQEMLAKMRQFEQVQILEEMKQNIPSSLPTEVDLNKQKRELQQQMHHLQLLEQMNQLKHIEELEKQHKFVEQKLMQQIKVSSPEILQFAMNISKRKKRK